MTRSIICLVFLLSIVSCASAPTRIHFYLLNSTATVDQQASQEKNNGKVDNWVVEDVELPAFLRQPGLVMQLGENRLIFSKTHLWAEPLADALPKVLRQNLQSRSDAFSFHTRGYNAEQKPVGRLRFIIDRLQVTDSGDALTEGQFLIQRRGDAEPLVTDFVFQIDLESDGYQHAVVKLETLLGLVADKVITLLTDLPVDDSK